MTVIWRKGKGNKVETARGEMSGHEPCIGYIFTLYKDFLPAMQFFFFRHNPRNNMQKDEMRL